MDDREHLISLIINAKRTDPETGSFTEYLADFLLGYGVKLPTLTPPNEPLTCEGCACEEYSRDTYPCNCCSRNEETISDQYRPLEGEA